jgi:hypothetical protein
MAATMLPCMNHTPEMLGSEESAAAAAALDVMDAFPALFDADAGACARIPATSAKKLAAATNPLAKRFIGVSPFPRISVSPCRAPNGVYW